ncbi:hypothetical protein [Fructilactobacillus lindneri]|uniref:Uncharacterized protein n=2 Tax=Fructilactobacillus lindneri TaxID=53444 RepID=A0A0R2JME8_9LACO|nr:hypothetical protein [Fructilactobacillus lindneri]ANZ59317.1 hypothetical protein AYR59_04520 [Fructilactobacillus lindneri]KRN78321.1 hypothetical protein IV52_GL001258 [Fructilactobacillus lindneri DSM 20690 = JCM 11027]POH04359.1 hypothetical protein BGL33_07015 [Fructilactobacillus lindneri]POH05348.1 hypothetical protein BGL35_06175 [Fructilactobacillus lindneri]POH05930.1 hypothetical protein BGL36_05805 [Fructilactobacillus lindneri]
MMAEIPAWVMYIAIFIFAAFYGKYVIYAIVSFFKFLKDDIEEMISNPRYYFKDFFGGPND